MKLLTIKNLNISDKEGQAIIKNVDLNIYNQSLNVIIGESGAGKSLTVKAILNHLPTQLHMSFDEFKMQGQNTSGIKQLLGKHIGYISQNYAQSFNEYTRLDKQLIAIYRYHFNVSKDNALKKIKKALTWVNLNDESIINKYSFQLSGGQLERVNIASVLMLDPELIIADEPVASLDVVNGHQIMQLLQHIVKDHHNTVLLITHNLIMIQFDHVDYSYLLKQPVLKDINISIQRGEKIGVLGESGAGKSTIGSLILGQLKPTKGKISIDSGKVLPIFQHATESFDRQFTIEQSLREPLLFYRQLIPQNIKNIILNYLIEFNLSTDLITKFPQEVSGGQLQRLNIIRSLLAQPDILVCDEITSNLDVMSDQSLINILLNEKNIQNKTLIVISHDLSVLQRLTNRIIVIKDGQIVDDFKSKDLFSHQRHPHTKLLIQTYE